MGKQRLSARLRAMMGGFHEPCGVPHQLGEGCTDGVLDAIGEHNDRMADVLWTFASAADGWEAQESPKVYLSNNLPVAVELGDCRRARSALVLPTDVG